MKSGTWWDEVREANAFTAPDKPRFEALLHLCLVSSELCSFLAARGHCSSSPDAAADQTAQKKQEAAGASDSRETKDKHNHRFAQHARCAKTPDPLSERSSRARTVEQSGRDRGQTVWPEQTEPRKSNMTRSLSARYTVHLHSTPRLNTFGCLPEFPCAGFVFIPYLCLLICFSCVRLPAQSANTITAHPRCPSKRSAVLFC